MTGNKERIVIVGGGIGGLTTALELSNTPEQRARYDITVYQMGWRLGGKCATGRNPRHGHRIEEHGIHGFMGSYFNALPLMKRVHDEWNVPADHPLADFSKAFPPAFSSFFWEFRQDQLLRWENRLEPNDLTFDQAPAFSSLTAWLRPLVDRLLAAAMARGLIPGFEPLTGTDRPIPWAMIAPLIDQPFPVPPQADDETRRRLVLFDLIATMLRGCRDDSLEVTGVDSIDEENFSDWLRRHGAGQDLLASPLILGTINVTYQYPDGDVSRPPLMSACGWLQWTLRGLIYMGAPYYLFAAGSGDTIVTPLYEVLKARGVRFSFFHRLSDVTPSACGTRIAALRFDVQAETRSGDYDPLIEVAGLRAWPDRPLHQQLRHGSELTSVDFENPFVDAPYQARLTLEDGRDFDWAVLAIPPRAIGEAAPGLCASRADWARVATAMATTATQSMQVYLDETVDDLDDPRTDFHLAGNFMSGMHGHVDFSKFLAFEAWPENRAPKGVLFFSGVMHDPPATAPQRLQETANLLARAEGLAVLRAGGGRLLPGGAVTRRNPVSNPFSLDFDLLHSTAPKGSGVARFDDQYWRANILPSERYTQCPPGTRKLRINPLKTGLANLTAAGDWVDTGLNVGSFEGAVMGGMLAARAIDRTLVVSDIVGCVPTRADHPEIA